MELIKENEYGNFFVSIDGRNIVFSGRNCKFPVRMYVYSDICEYAGLAEGDENVCTIRYVCRMPPVSIVISNGRIDCEHSIVCEFNIDRTDHTFDVFSLPILVNCLRFYGHLVSYRIGSKKIYAIPSDYYTHPLPELSEYAYWYNFDCGLGIKGYYFIGYDETKTPFFVKKTLFQEIVRNSNFFFRE